MKTLTLLFASFLSLPFAHAANTENDCDQITMYRPEAQNSVDAARVFSYELHSAGCQLRKVITLTKQQYIYIQSFERSGRLVYELVDFTSGHAVTQICEVNQHMVRPSGMGPQEAIARFEYGAPKCVAKPRD